MASEVIIEDNGSGGSGGTGSGGPNNPAITRPGGNGGLALRGKRGAKNVPTVPPFGSGPAPIPSSFWLTRISSGGLSFPNLTEPGLRIFSQGKSRLKVSTIIVGPSVKLNGDTDPPRPFTNLLITLDDVAFIYLWQVNNKLFWGSTLQWVNFDIDPLAYYSKSFSKIRSIQLNGDAPISVGANQHAQIRFRR